MSYPCQAAKHTQVMSPFSQPSQNSPWSHPLHPCPAAEDPAGKRSHTAAGAAARGCLSSHGTARLTCAGERPQQLLTQHWEQTTTCLQQPGLAPGLRHPPHDLGRASRLGWPGAMPLAQERPPKRGWHAPLLGTEEPRHARGPAATRLGGGGPGAVTGLGRGPGESCHWKGSHRQLLPAEESLAWLGGCHRQPGSCPSSQGCSCLTTRLDLPPRRAVSP